MPTFRCGETLSFAGLSRSTITFPGAGATVLATPQTDSLYRAAARRSFAIAEGRAELPEVRIEVVGERRQISDGNRTIELIPVGENPHVEEMLVVYFPEQKWLYVADFFEPVVPPRMFPLPSHTPINRFFAGWLERSGLEMERIYGSHSFRPARREHVERAGGG